MKNMLKRIAISLGILYDPGTAIRLPGEEQEAPQPRQRKSKPDTKPDGAEVVASAAGPQYFRRTSEEVFEYENIQAGTARQSELSEEDVLQLELAGADMTERAIAKATELKRLWAKGMTNSQIEARYKGKRGYSLRTIKTFTGAFSKAECSSVQK